MGLPGWSTTEPVDAGDLTLLPRGAEWSSDPNGVTAENIRNTTTGGRVYDNVLFDYLSPEFSFHFPQSENSQFYALYLAGRAVDIYYVPDSDDMGTVLHGRLEETSYLPKNTGQPGHIDGSMQMWFRWLFRFRTVVPALEIED